MNKPLFDEFDAVSSKQWKQKIQFDLKGADYNDALVWQSNEGITVKPFYHADEFNELPTNSDTKATSWKICQSIYVNSADNANAKALDAIEKGCDVIKFILPSEDLNLDDLLKGLSQVGIFIEPLFISETFSKNLIGKFPGVNLNFDIIHNLTKTGNWYSNLKTDFETFGAIFKNTSSFSVSTNSYQNAGANMVQQLAYALSHANEYLNYLDENRLLNASTHITYKAAVGTNYFFEIAKLRALRKLHKALAEVYQIDSKCSIFVTPTARNKTIYDYNTNMLRSTTESMSAILGGANVICNAAYDAIYKKDNDFSQRISKNQLLILKHESYFDKVDNPADGSYYIENLTNQFAEKGLKLFKEIEQQGGFLKQLKARTIQRKIKESAKKEQELFDAGKAVLVGTNIQPNPSDQMKSELELYPFLKTKKRKTLIEPIIEYRLAEKIEQSRLKNEN